jgi:hypothetical protein
MCPSRDLKAGIRDIPQRWPGEVPVIHVLDTQKTWMPGTYAKTRFALLPGHDERDVLAARLQDKIIPVGALRILRSEDIFRDAPF